MVIFCSFPVPQVLGVDVQDAVCINVKSHLDLGDPPRSRRNSHQMKFAQRLVPLRHRTLPLEDMDFNRGLTVGRRRETFALASGNRGVARNQDSADRPQGFNTEGKRRHIQKEQIFHISAQHAGLDGSSHGHDLIRVYSFVGILLEEVTNDLLHPGNAGRSTYQNHFLYVSRLEAGIGKCLPAGLTGSLQDIFGQLLKLGPCQFHIQVLGTPCVGGDEGQVDVGFLRRR